MNWISRFRPLRAHQRHSLRRLYAVLSLGNPARRLLGNRYTWLNAPVRERHDVAVAKQPIFWLLYRSHRRLLLKMASAPHGYTGCSTNQHCQGGTHESTSRHHDSDDDPPELPLDGACASGRWRRCSPGPERPVLGLSSGEASPVDRQRPNDWGAIATGVSDGRYRSTCWLGWIAVPPWTIHAGAQAPSTVSMASSTLRARLAGMRTTISSPSRRQVMGLSFESRIRHLPRRRRRVHAVSQVGPINVWTQVFAAHLAAGLALDGRTILGRDRPSTLDQLIDHGRRNMQRTSHVSLGTNKPAGALYSGFVFQHGRKFSIANSVRQAMLNPSVVSIAV